MLQTFYVTFKEFTTYPYKGGWIVILAEDKDQACRYVRKKFNNFLYNCYSKEEFRNQMVYQRGKNAGHACHDIFDATTDEKLAIPQLELDNLIVETTRKCNMACQHCLRGEPENRKMYLHTLVPLLNYVTSIHTITFSGGEPSLNVPFMEDLLDYIKDHDIPVHSFYIVTNGKELSDRFLVTMLRWYAYCCQYGEPEYCGIALSKDEFHEEIPTENEMVLRGFSFFTEDKFSNFEKDRYLLRKGRAESLSEKSYRFIARGHDYDAITVSEYDGTYTIEDELYVSCNGDMTNDCDLSYKEIPGKAIGSTRDIDAFVEYVVDRAKE